MIKKLGILKIIKTKSIIRGSYSNNLAKIFNQTTQKSSLEYEYVYD